MQNLLNSFEDAFKKYRTYKGEGVASYYDIPDDKIEKFWLEKLNQATQAERSRIEEIIVGYFGEEGKSQATVLLRMLPTNTERTESVLEMLDQQIGRAARALGEV